MTQRQRTVSIALVAGVIVVGFIAVNRYFEVSQARAHFSERFENAYASLALEGREVLDWGLLRAIEGRDGFPGALTALEGEEVTVIGFVTPHDVTGRLRIYGGRHSNYDNPLTYENVVELELSPLPKMASFTGALPAKERIRARIADRHGTIVHAEYPQLYRGRLVLDANAAHGAVVQLLDAEHLTAAKR